MPYSLDYLSHAPPHPGKGEEEGGGVGGVFQQERLRVANRSVVCMLVGRHVDNFSVKRWARFLTVTCCFPGGKRKSVSSYNPTIEDHGEGVVVPKLCVEMQGKDTGGGGWVKTLVTADGRYLE